LKKAVSAKPPAKKASRSWAKEDREDTVKKRTIKETLGAALVEAACCPPGGTVRLICTLFS
ncbi:MAG: hypothetical protein LBQ57_09955, partial [Spirochaetales bacterium]|nr:hypothetical protein [Spirochaetales bacterium]